VTDNAARRVQVDYESGEKLYLQIARIIRDRIISGELPVGDRVVSRMPTEEERDRLSTGYLTPVLIVTRSDGRVEAYNAAVTVCSSERLTGRRIEGRRPRRVESRHGRFPIAVLGGAGRRLGARGHRGLAVQVVHVVLAA
jgi:hypothetical protein